MIKIQRHVRVRFPGSMVRSAALIALLVGGYLHATASAQMFEYGMVTQHFDGSFFAPKMSELGAGFARVDFPWNVIEPTCKGPACQNWAAPDAWASEAAARNVVLYVNLLDTPGWANGGAGKLCPPTNWQDWYDFVHAVVTRFNGVNGPLISYWGMWNEAEDNAHWCGTALQYEQLVMHGHNAVKAANPNAFVVGPEAGEGSVNPRSWFRDRMAAIGHLLDVVSVHWYGGENASLSIFMDNWVLPYSQGKPVWLTEIGKTACVLDPAQEAAQTNFYNSAIADYRNRRSWWTMIFFYRLADDLSCSKSIAQEPSGYNKDAFYAYQYRINTQGATFFGDINYKGGSFDAGSSMSFVGLDWNDRISSVRVPRGKRVVLYEHDNFGGSFLNLNATSAADLRAFPGPGADGTWNDAASSIEVFIDF